MRIVAPIHTGHRGNKRGRAQNVFGRVENVRWFAHHHINIFRERQIMLPWLYPTVGNAAVSAAVRVSASGFREAQALIYSRANHALNRGHCPRCDLEVFEMMTSGCRRQTHLDAGSNLERAQSDFFADPAHGLSHSPSRARISPAGRSTPRPATLAVAPVTRHFAPCVLRRALVPCLRSTSHFLI